MLFGGPSAVRNVFGTGAGVVIGNARNLVGHFEYLIIVILRRQAGIISDEKTLQ